HKDLESAIIYNKNFIVNDKDTAEIHGTAVAGLIGARENNFGIKGLAPDSKLLALRACRQVSKDYPMGECYSSTMIKALDTGIQNNAKIINMSLGSLVEDKLMSKLITAGSGLGVLFVAPAGNTKEINYLSFPASHPNVIAVAGQDENGSFFPNNTIGEKADFCTPCKNLFTTIPGNNHNFISGTSMSAAVVSGLLSLACEDNPEFNLKNLNRFKGDLQALITHIKTK
ncbi:MAG: S8 family serine peptidase, partial [Desulfobacula sp.]|nr:S8 family serine peptidase [Desulfobacula sp.]